MQLVVGSIAILLGLAQTNGLLKNLLKWNVTQRRNKLTVRSIVTNRQFCLMSLSNPTSAKLTASSSQLHGSLSLQAYMRYQFQISSLKLLLLIVLLLSAFKSKSQRITLDRKPSYKLYNSNGIFKGYLTADTITQLSDSLWALGYITESGEGFAWYLHNSSNFLVGKSAAGYYCYGQLLLAKYSDQSFKLLNTKSFAVIDSQITNYAIHYPWLTITKRDAEGQKKHVYNVNNGRLSVRLSAGAWPESHGMRFFKTNGRFGALNLRGDTIVPFDFQYIEQIDFKHFVGSRSGNKLGVFTHTGIEVYPDTFLSVRLLTHELMLVKHTGGLWLTDIKLHSIYGGLCDSFYVHPSGWLTHVTDTGSFFISPDGCRIQRSGLTYGLSDPEYLLVKNGPHWEIYNDQAEMTSFGFENITPGYKSIESRSEGLYPTNQDGRMGAISIEGLKRLGQRYDSVKHFHEGRAPIKLMLQESWGGWGYITKKDSLVVQPIYDSVSVYCNGLAVVKRTKDYQILDLSSKELLPANTTQVVSDICGGYLFKNKNRWGYLSDRGEQILLPKYKQIIRPDCFTLIFQSLSGKWGMKRTNPQLEVEAIYDRIEYNPATQSYLLWQDKWGE